MGDEHADRADRAGSAGSADRAADGDSDADAGAHRGGAPGGHALLGRLLEQHMPALRAYVARRADRQVLGRESRSDLVQSVCREVVEHGRRYEHRDVESFRHWLFHTAERKIIDRYRYWTAGKRDALRDVPATADGVARAPSPSQDAAAAEQALRLGAAMERLPAHYRDVIRLARLEDRPLREVARAMGRSEDSVRNLLFRALGLLSDELACGGDVGHGGARRA
jgi:RNA polymerase sigma-70 factor (ECF subfamily)